MVVFRRILAVLLVAAAVAATGWRSAAQSVELTLLHFNDVYEISPEAGAGGFAPLMTLIRAERARARHSLTTFGGDLISPSVLSSLTQGRHMIELMNAVGIDAAGLGNHEFDFGPAVLKERLAESRFPWLASNTYGADGKPFAGLAATLVREVGGLKIGFLALLAPETAQQSSPGPGVDIRPPAEAAAPAVAALRAAGADLVVAVTHLGLAEDRALARAVKGIDVVLGGHDHDPMTIYEGGVLILKAGSDAHFLAVADLKLEKRQDGAGAKVTMRPQWRYLSTAGVAPDPEMAKLVAAHEARLAAELEQTVATTAVALDLRQATVRGAESNFGNLVADALRKATGAEAALVNGGGIRGDRVLAAGSPISRKDVLAALPFRNIAVLLELSGAELKAALENGVSMVEQGAGRFPQVSGIGFSYDASAPAGQRVLEVSVGGRPLEPARRYRLATNDYLARGGDGYASLAGAKAIVDASGGPLLTTVLMDYLAARGSPAPAVEGRIRRR
jgi:2',3'-cyclic-nucleotide 2'-phosphodiesterase (5'-nucleotidase family)